MRPWTNLAGLLIASNAWAAGGGDFFEATLVKDVSTLPASVGSDPDDFHAFGGKLYFSAHRRSVGREIFASDGVAPAATLVTEFAPGVRSSHARLLGSAGDRLVVFAVANVNDGGQIWSLDPVSGARVQLSALPATADVWVNRIGTAAGRVFFGNSTDGSLWASDGTAPTTQFAVSLPNYVYGLAEAGGLLHLIGYVSASVPYYGYFVSDATQAGTRAVPHRASTGCAVRELVRSGRPRAGSFVSRALITS